MKLWYRFAFCLSVSFLVGCTASDEAPQPSTIVVPSPTITVFSTPTSAEPVPTYTAVLTSEPEIVSTERPTAAVRIALAVCQETFCPPYWLTEQASQLLEFPGIYGGEGLNEFLVLITYDPTLLTEEEVVLLFSDITNFEVYVADEGG